MVTKGKKFRWCAALAAAAVLAVSMAGLVACGSDDEDTGSSTVSSSVEDSESGGTEVVEEAELVGSYVYGEEGELYLSTYGMTLDAYDSYLVKVYDDDTYEMVYTQSMSMYGSYVTIVVQTEGTYTSSLDDDDMTVYALSEAAEIDYKTAGMFSIHENSETSTFPVEILGGDTVTADEFAEMYGAGMTIRIDDSGSTFTITDETGSGEPAATAGDSGLVGSYVYGEEGELYLSTYGMTLDAYDSYLVKVYDDDTYEMVYTQSMSMYGSYVTIVVQTEGTCTSSLDDDDMTVYALSEAAEIDYKTAGMFSIHENSETSTFPVEILGGDTVTADEFAEMYGAAVTVRIDDSGSTFTII